MVEAALDAVAYGMVAGKWLVEYLPSLRYMPSWFPGSGEQACFVEWRKACSVLKNAPFEHSKSAMVRNILFLHIFLDLMSWYENRTTNAFASLLWVSF